MTPHVEISDRLAIKKEGKDAVYALFPQHRSQNEKKNRLYAHHLPEIIFLSSDPPRECGIATYSQDLFKAIGAKFIDSFPLKICALESGGPAHVYPDEVSRILHTKDSAQYD